jgi:glutamate dehydrogenase
MTLATYNLYEIAQQQFDHAAQLLDLEQSVRDLLRVPMHEHMFSVPLRTDGGEKRVLRGFRVLHNDARGPGKGGIRFHPLQTIDTMRGLAMHMTWRAAVVDLPLGGSMGGVVCDPHDLSLYEQEKVCRGWVRRLARDLGPDLDVPSPDLMTGDHHMVWMLDEYEAIRGHKSPGFITGKPVGMGGSFGRKEATGYGVMITVREALKALNLKPENTSLSIQGFGNVGQSAVQLYKRMGGTVACVSSWNQEEKCAYSFYKKDGIDIDALLKITNMFGEVDKKKAGNLGCQVLPGEAWLEQAVDILIPAAIENQITPENFKSIHGQVKMIAEGAHGPINPAVEKPLLDKGIHIIPDVLANAGGVICSYFEQVQSNMNYYWRKDEVLGKLDSQMTAAYYDVHSSAERNSLNLRDGAYLIAVDRVARACQERGWA